RMKDGAILANSGHFNVEINIPGLEALAVKRQQVRPLVEEFTLADGRHIYLLGEGRLINLAAAEGHPASVMDMSFANQALSVRYLAERGAKLPHQVHPVPRDIDREVGRLKLKSLGVAIDELTSEQQKYQESWESGT
ncbi:MAG: adenosylhomocysteinase, partial [Chloroflexi bacterium]|nr:adenosylhomocysteinase [Chloroflexota bacterium]